MESLGELLRRYRTAAGLTQEALAERSGLSVQGISALERGFRRFPRSVTLGLLAEALGLNDDERAVLVDAASIGRQRRQPPPVPRQLPYAIADFTGRQSQIERLVKAVTDGEIVAITGMGGVGKTALAVHVAHQVVDAYPDGQLYLDLHGYGAGSPLSTREALRVITRSLGAEDAPDAAMTADRLRLMLAGRRVLLLLDNVADVEHVAELLPDVAGSTAIVTSRHSLTSLAGAMHLHLDVLSDSEALEMLSGIAGAHRVSGEPAAALRVITRCGHLPLAIRVAGARLAARPVWPIEHLADRLADERHRLDELEVPDLGVRAIRFAVDRRSADTVGLLALPDWHDISVPIAARLLDRSEGATAEILQGLVDANLLTETRPGFYRQHDLLRAYGRDHASKALTDDERAAALTRALDLYVAVTWWAKRRIRASAMALRWADPSWSDGAPDFADTAEATAWLDAERTNIVPAARQAVQDPTLDSHRAVRLAVGLYEYLLSRHDWDATRGLCELALSVPSDPTGQFLARYQLCRPYGELGLYDEAISHMRECVRLAEALNEPRAQAFSFISIGWTMNKAGKPAEAVEYADRGFRMSRQLGDRFGEAYACWLLGTLYAALGMRRDREAFNLRGRALYGQLDDEASVALTLIESADASSEAGQHHAALADLHDVLEIYHRLDQPADAASVLERLGAAYDSLGNFDQAMDCLYEGQTICELHNEWQLEAQIRRRMGHLLVKAGRTAEALEQWQVALTILNQHGVTTESGDLRALLAAHGA
jgi:transcriptional regulator with XRE-family HTH domain/tetratricopeptide (TPR) repeat protein